MERLKPDEVILTAYAAPCAGPGWANSPIIVIAKGPDGIRQFWLQPEDHSLAMSTLYDISASVNRLMVAAVEQVMKKEKRCAD